jgi:hypothetical protein
LIVKKIKLYQIASIFLLFLLAIISGNRMGGFDYEPYLLMIRYVQEVDGIFAKILVAKDPMFGAIVSFVDPIYSSDYVKVFLFISMLAFITITFAVLYIFLLSPSLDFAAIRALLGMGFLIAFLNYYSKKQLLVSLVFAFLSIASHISMVLPILLSFSLIKVHYEKHKYMFVSLFFVCTLFTKPIFSLFKNTSTYIDVGGTLLGYLPIIFLILNLIIYFELVKGEINTKFNEIVIYVSLILAVFALAMLHNVIVISARYMQISQMLFLVALCSANFRLTKNKMLLWLLSLILFSIPLIQRNISLHLWQSVMDNI